MSSCSARGSNEWHQQTGHLCGCRRCEGSYAVHHISRLDSRQPCVEVPLRHHVDSVAIGDAGRGQQGMLLVQPVRDGLRSRPADGSSKVEGCRLSEWEKPSAGHPLKERWMPFGDRHPSQSLMEPQTLSLCKAVVAPAAAQTPHWGTWC